MTHEKEAPRIAVIGMGPRSLGALEALATRMGDGATPLRVETFDPFPACGAGPNFDPRELAICRLNIPMRDIDIRPPEFSRCGSFAEWLQDSPGPDVFPSRADLGRYLEARLDDLRAAGRLDLHHNAATVTDLQQRDEGWMVRLGRTWQGPYQEVLLSLGQPEVEPDDQLAQWQRHALTSAGVLAQAYPARRLGAEAANWAGQRVAVRGLALSAFDVLRVLTTEQGGRFADGCYVSCGAEPARILPFSLDGLPPYPKPETKEVDASFDPREAETQVFADAIADAACGSPASARTRLSRALEPVVARILSEQGNPAGAADVSARLMAEWQEPGSQETAPPHEALMHGIAMAEGSAVPTIGYAIGQVWRKWQDALRSGYNPADTSPDTAEVIVAFDEGLKRYSYGPPVSSSRELAALIDAGIVDLGHAVDPDVSQTDTGWELATSAGRTAVDVMIDAVMPSPDLSVLRAPVLVGLVNGGRLSPLAEALAANTGKDGQVVGRDGGSVAGLCLLGRLALGSVVAADSLHDCFGEASHRWAEGVVDRLGLLRAGR